MEVYIIQDFAFNVIRGVFAKKEEAYANLREGWFVTPYKVEGYEE